eukprot:352598-Chlamydomonas_euryale.AAC.15
MAFCRLSYCQKTVPFNGDDRRVPIEARRLAHIGRYPWQVSCRRGIHDRCHAELKLGRQPHECGWREHHSGMVGP